MRTFLVIVFACCVVAAQAAYEFSNVTLIQRWPWNQLVDVEFDVKQPAGRQSMRLGARLELTATVGGVSTVLDAATLSDTYVFGEGRKRIVWNPMPQFAGQDMKNVQLSFRTLEEDVPLGYLVVKIDDGSWWYKPLSFSNEVNTTTYKTTHLAFRYIPSTVSSTWLDMSGGTDTFRIGSDGSRATALGMNSTDVYVEKQADIRLTKGFFMGVFPLTRAQYVGLGYSLYGIPTNEVPVRGLNYNILRGDDTAEGYCYPTNRAVASDSLIGRLRRRTRLDFDLPTEAQWEYACKAGSTNAYWFTATDELPALETLTNRVKNAYVTRFPPNAWGLYAMVGCSHQWTTTLGRTTDNANLNAWNNNNLVVFDEGAVDPVGPVPSYSNPYRIVRGSHFNADVNTTQTMWDGVARKIVFRVYRTGYRYPQKTNISASEKQLLGARLCLTLP